MNSVLYDSANKLSQQPGACGLHPDSVLECVSGFNLYMQCGII